MRITKTVEGGAEYQSVTQAEWDLEAKKKQAIFDRYKKMTMSEINYWREQWAKYYEDVQKTDAFQLHAQMVAAVRAGNRALIRELRERNQKLVVNSLTKPSFPHPDQILYYMPKEQKDDMFESKKQKKVKRKEMANSLIEPNF